MDSSFGKEGILSRLRLLDEDLDFRFGGARKFELVISGGSALSIRGLIPSRVTTDIDVLSVPDEVVDLMSAYDHELSCGHFPVYVSDSLARQDTSRGI